MSNKNQDKNELDLHFQWLTDNDPIGICELNHGKVTAPIAIASLAIKDEGQYFTFRVCQECVDALESDEWSLLICMECACTAWAWKRYTRRNFPQITKFTNGCPNCRTLGDKDGTDA